MDVTLYQLILNHLEETVFVTDAAGAFVFIDPRVEHLLGYSVAEVEQLHQIEQLLGDRLFNPALLAAQGEICGIERQVFDRAGYPHLLSIGVKCVRLPSEVVLYFCREVSRAESYALLEQRLQQQTTELQRVNQALAQQIYERQQAEQALRSQAEYERLLGASAQRIRQSLNLEEILATTVAEVRQVLQTDRVLIYRFEADWSGIMAVESVAPPWISVLGTVIDEPSVDEWSVERFKQGVFYAFPDIATADVTPCYRALMTELQVKANLVVPIVTEKKLWGLLIAHHCRATREWQDREIQLLRQLAIQVGIAIQQSGLFQHVQRLNVNLEYEVQVRTAQLQQALNFETRLKRITDKVRDSLDETQILQTAVQELALGLQVDCCDAGMYSPDHKLSTIAYEYTIELPAVQGQTLTIHQDDYHYRQLLQGQYVQFCPTDPTFIRQIDNQSAVLACPIVDDQGVMGDLWLFKPREEAFNDLEVRLVQQVANQCAIALRQARLFQATQAQVQELERLHYLKDDFLSTVSHELRTPMSNIKMATQMLEIVLQQAGVFAADPDHATRYFQILYDECQRETRLINDLLDLSRLEADSEPLLLMAIDLTTWISHIMEPFEERAKQQQQYLEARFPTNLPQCLTDLSSLERIITELLSNACKYTPLGGQIIVAIELVKPEDRAEPTASPIAHPSFLITVSNSGVEIEPGELDQIFDKFYRIPDNDPWKHDGTGLGLALVKRLVTRLQGKVWATSQDSWVTLALRLPLSLPA